MARIRSVHPELFLDEAFVELSMAARVLAIGLWTQADDRGIFEWKPSRFKMTIFPNDTLELPLLLSELETQNCIKKFEIDGKSYGAVRNFCLFQRPRMPSYRHPFPEFCNNYVAFDRRKDVSLPRDCGSPDAPLTQLTSTITENRPHRRGEERSRRGEESNTDREKPVVVVVPDEKAETTTTTTVSKPALQGRGGLASLTGTPLPADWVPDDQLCEKVFDDFAMTMADVSAELPAFHALNVQNGTLSRDWGSTFYLFAKRWKERAAKAAPPRVELSRGADKPFVPTEKDWDGAVRIYAANGRWNPAFGADPLTGRCKCPKDILVKHGIDPATGEKLRPISPSVEGGNAAQ